MTIWVTGCAGFIGQAVSLALLAQGHAVLGLDNLTPYYDVKLKQQRLAQLANKADFRFEALDIAKLTQLQGANLPKPEAVIHLAAQAGVRYSLEAPLSYIEANVAGQTALLEYLRLSAADVPFIYASSSSVYGRNAKTPFAETDAVEMPASLYAASKRSAELIAETYAHLYRLPCVGLRFFTVYGPWGRPDMAYWSFTEKLLGGQPITLFNNGQMQRDFTYIDDIVSGILAALKLAPAILATLPTPHRLYNLGNDHPEKLTDFVAHLAKACGVEPVLQFAPMQKGDVVRTAADINRARAELNFTPTTRIETGLGQFVDWFRSGQYNIQD